MAQPVFQETGSFRDEIPQEAFTERRLRSLDCGSIRLLQAQEGPPLADSEGSGRNGRIVEGRRPGSPGPPAWPLGVLTEDLSRM